MRCKTTMPFAIAVLVCSLFSGIARADQIDFTLYGNSASATEVVGGLEVSRDYVNANAVDMNVIAEASSFVASYYGGYVYEITETITNNAGDWGDFKWILNPDLPTPIEGMSIRAITDLDDTPYKYDIVTDQLIQIVGKENGGLILQDSVIEMKYEIVLDAMPTESVAFAVRAIDRLAPVPTPSASIALVGLFGSLLLFGVRRNRRAAQDS